MNTSKEFEFKDPGQLIDAELELVLVEKRPEDPREGMVPEYKFEMRHTDTAETIGFISLRTGLTPALSEYGGHIGYEVAPSYRGKRYAARSCKLLFNLARHHGINPILITCADSNLASKRTCEIIGGELVGVKTLHLVSVQNRPTCYYHVGL